MEISVIGAGVVGQATGEGFKRFGHQVTYYDKGDKPVLGKVTFICTPEDAVEEILDKFTPAYDVFTIVVRSTVPVGTCTKYGHVCHNPEFLRESVADYEFMNPGRIIVGECCEAHGDVLTELYEPFCVPIVRVDTPTSELIKLVSNAYLATQISFWNQIDMIAEKLGLNSHVVARACMLDPRISSYGASMHGAAYGGKCLPKDVAQLKLVANGVDICLLEAVQKINNHVKAVKENNTVY